MFLKDVKRDVFLMPNVFKDVFSYSEKKLAKVIEDCYAAPLSKLPKKLFPLFFLISMSPSISDTSSTIIFLDPTICII